jgi:hypothetical protein
MPIGEAVRPRSGEASLRWLADCLGAKQRAADWANRIRVGPVRPNRRAGGIQPHITPAWAMARRQRAEASIVTVGPTGVKAHARNRGEAATGRRESGSVFQEKLAQRRRAERGETRRPQDASSPNAKPARGRAGSLQIALGRLFRRAGPSPGRGFFQPAPFDVAILNPRPSLQSPDPSPSCSACCD